MLSGLSAAIAGILLTAYLGTAKADMGAEYTLPIITAVVLGGTSNLGGSGGVIGTALAALAVGFLRIGLSLNGVLDAVSGYPSRHPAGGYGIGSLCRYQPQTA